MPSTPYLIEAPGNVTHSAESFFDAIAQGNITQDEAAADLGRSFPQGMSTTYEREPLDFVDIERFSAYTSGKPYGVTKPEAAWEKLQATAPHAFDTEDGDAVLDPTMLFDFLETTYRNPGQYAIRPRHPLLGLAIAVADHFGGPSQAPQPAELETYRLLAKSGARSVPLVGEMAVENAWHVGGKISFSNEATKGYRSVAELLLRGTMPKPSYVATYQKLRPGKLYTQHGVFFQPVPGSEPSPIAIEPHYFAAAIDVAIANGLGNDVLGAADFHMRVFRRLLGAREDAAAATPQS